MDLPADVALAVTSSSSSSASNPGLTLTPADLADRWDRMMEYYDVFEFNGHVGDGGCFSNFYDQSKTPFTFEVPREWCNFELSDRERIVSCKFSEKAIMICKAAIMGDAEAFFMILQAKTAFAAKRYGREVKNFDQVLWNRMVCAVAYLTVFEKFRQDPDLRGLLLATGGRVIAEATKRDAMWGIGLDIGDPRAKVPARWRGTNILGWALMEARERLQ